ncbi:hypothetical protein [uncultured Shewanella sp.]|uniref:hypothetical protein n=1 Tax=uncultured Shewanella sp. TaxID=173975 RepID=UPI0026238084|nr:hypothetical protein [uncultured Shewanella sp.]
MTVQKIKSLLLIASLIFTPLLGITHSAQANHSSWWDWGQIEPLNGGTRANGGGGNTQVN